MTARPTSVKEEAWVIIEREKRTDRFIRRVSITAWTITFLIALFFTVMTGIQIAEFWRLVLAGGLPRTEVIRVSMPLIIVLGFLSVLIATLSTVGIFLRLRTASFAEIQLRLAALEEMLSSKPDSDRPDHAR
jgi:hypothetical protein